MIYYKGSINEYESIKNFLMITDSLAYSVNNRVYSDDFSYIINNIMDYSDQMRFLRLLKNLYDRNSFDKELLIEEKSDIYNYFKSMGFKLRIKKDDSYLLDIIYSKVTDIKGRTYARELKTGLLFPLYDENNISFDYYVTKYIDENYGINKNNHGTCSLLIKPRVLNDNIAKVSNIIISSGVASLNDIEEYEEDVDIDYIIESSKDNVFIDEIEERKEIIKDEKIDLIGNIELNLSRLNKFNKDKRDELYKEYEFILKNFDRKDLNIPITIDNLRSINDKIKFNCLFNSNNRYSLLDNSIRSFFEEDNDNNLLKINTINQLDKIYELFIKSNNELNLEEQRNVLLYLSYLYILIISKNDMKVNEIITTHFIDLITYIISILQLLDIYYLNDEIDYEEVINSIRFSNLKSDNIKLILGK